MTGTHYGNMRALVTALVTSGVVLGGVLAATGCKDSRSQRNTPSTPAALRREHPEFSDTRELLEAIEDGTFAQRAGITERDGERAVHRRDEVSSSRNEQGRDESARADG